jgi:drug/metabolite transporter (DMT)-like permease
MLEGIGLKVASTLFFSGMVAIVKTYAGDYPLAEIVFFRSFFALFVLVAWLWARREFPAALHTKQFTGHLLRSLAGTASLACSFSAFGLLPLADATAIGYAGPLFIVAFAGLMLKETVGPARWGAVALGSCGVMLMLWEHIGVSQTETSRGALGAFLALMAAVFVAIAMIQTRRLVQTEHMGAVIFYFQATASAFAAAFMLIAWSWPGSGGVADFMHAQAWMEPRARDWGPLIAAGLLGGMGQLLMTSSYKLADASVIACFDYTSMIWALVLGAVFFAETPSPIVLTGAAIVAAAGILVILSERRWRRMA